MSFELVIKNILKNKYSISYKNGVSHFNKENVKLIDIKEVNNYINVYGRVYDNAKVYNTQIRFNKVNNKYELICNCDLCKDIRAAGMNNPCEHIVATALLINKKDNKYVDDSSSINIILRLEENYSEEYSYRAILFIEGKGRIKISSNKDLEYNIFSKEGIYSVSKIKYSKENKKLFKLLKEADFNIKGKDIREILFYSKEVLINIKVNSIEYEGEANRENLPLKFTLKCDNNKIKLQEIKTPLILLNEEGTAFIYNREIYIPPFNQCKLYMSLYKVIGNKHYTYVKESSLEKIIKVLKNIGQLTINEDVRNILIDRMKIKLNFYLKDNNLYCSFSLDKKYLLKTNKVKLVEEILFSHKFTKKDEEYLFTGEDENLLNLLKSDIYEYCDIVSSKELGNFSIINSLEINKHIKRKQNNIQFNLETKDINEDEFIKALNSYKNGEEFYRFNNYSFMDFSDKKSSELMELLSFINYNGENTVVPVGYEEVFNNFILDSNYREIININEESNKENIRKPRGLKADLRNYQKEGLRWLQDKKEKGLFGILADEMGLGKTLQAISYILLNRREKTMVVTQTSLVYNWKAEFEKFAPSLKVACIHGSKSKREKYFKEFNKYNVILTSYGTLNMDIDKYENIVFDNLIIDEGQNIKNSKAKVTKNIKSIKSKTKFVLSGTPIENNLMELWSIFDFLRPGYLFSEKEFKNKFNSKSEEQIKYLKLVIKPFILRRTKKEVLKELPNKIEYTYYVDMTDEQNRYYKSSLKKAVKESKHLTNHISILSLLTRLRQIALDPAIVDENYTGGSGKINVTIELIKKYLSINKKMLIFSQFTTLLDKLKTELNKNNIKYYYLDGSTKAEERLKLCNDFNNDEEIKVFLISLKAGGTGLNLTSAEVVIHFDPWWNPAVENQATDRAHRIGQKNEVEVIKIISKNTIEENIFKLQEEKSHIFSQLLSDDMDISYNKLTKEELEYLFNYEI